MCSAPIRSGFPSTFDSILSETEHPTRTRGLQYGRRDCQTEVSRIAVRATIKYGAVSIYDDEDIYGEGGFRIRRPRRLQYRRRQSRHRMQRSPRWIWRT